MTVEHKVYLLDCGAVTELYEKELAPVLANVDRAIDRESILMGEVLSICKCETIPGMPSIRLLMEELSVPSDIRNNFMSKLTDLVHMLISNAKLPSGYMAELSLMSGYLVRLDIGVYADNF